MSSRKHPRYAFALIQGGSGDSQDLDSDKDYGGWVLIYRSLIEHELWLKERFTQGQAWVDLILLASHKGHISTRGNVATPVKCGQVLTSQMKLAERWRWNRETVALFLKLLKTLKMASIETSSRTSTGYTMITLLNYERLQKKLMGDPALDPALDPAVNPAVAQQSPSTIKERVRVKSRVRSNNHNLVLGARRAGGGGGLDPEAEAREVGSVSGHSRNSRREPRAGLAITQSPGGSLP